MKQWQKRQLKQIMTTRRKMTVMKRQGVFPKTFTTTATSTLMIPHITYTHRERLKKMEREKAREEEEGEKT